MSLKDLKEAGLILPEDEWGKLTFQKPYFKFPILLTFLLTFLSCILMYIGDGTWITWIGLLMFLLLLALFTFFSIKSINIQMKKLENYCKSKNKEYILES